jgi:hypothetical protein
MAVRTSVEMVELDESATSRELMSRTPVAVVAVAIATPPELVELAAVETEAAEETSSQRKALTDLVAAVELLEEVSQGVSVSVADQELSLCDTQRLRLRQILLRPLSLAPHEQAQHCQLLLMPGLVHLRHTHINGSVRQLQVVHIPIFHLQQIVRMY